MEQELKTVEQNKQNIEQCIYFYNVTNKSNPEFRDFFKANKDNTLFKRIQETRRLIKRKQNYIKHMFNEMIFHYHCLMRNKQFEEYQKKYTEFQKKNLQILERWNLI